MISLWTLKCCFSWRLAGLSSALAFPLDLGARPLCRRLRGRGCANCQSLPQAELFVRQRERPGLRSPAVAWPPSLSAGRRESGSQRPWLGEAAPSQRDPPFVPRKRLPDWASLELSPSVEPSVLSLKRAFYLFTNFHIPSCRFIFPSKYALGWDIEYSSSKPLLEKLVLCL